MSYYSTLTELNRELKRVEKEIPTLTKQAEQPTLDHKRRYLSFLCSTINTLLDYQKNETKILEGKN